MHLIIKQRFKLAFFLIGVTLVVGTLIFFNANSTSIHDELVALYLIPKPEAFTELYFKDSANLPTSATSNQAISFTFVIHNLETTDYQYAYVVAVDANSSRHIVDSGNILVKNNQYYAKNEQTNLINSLGRQNVVVELTNIHQSIDFWVVNSQANR